MKIRGWLNALLPTPVCANDSDTKAFLCAEVIENGGMRESLCGMSRALQESGMYYIYSGSGNNEWILRQREPDVFLMRAIIFVESESGFTNDFRVQDVAKESVICRVRIAIYLSEPIRDSSNTTQEQPAVVMMSCNRRREWKAYAVVCDSCRFKRRRSSFTDVLQDINTTSSVGGQCPPKRSGFPPECVSPCSFGRSHAEAQRDYGDICSAIPSMQFLLKIVHSACEMMSVSFTHMELFVPREGGGICPLTADVPDLNVARGTHMFCTKRPIWSDKFKALALDFETRSVLASRRNFQIVVDNDPAMIYMQHYRTGRTEYTVELNVGNNAEKSLSLLQSFCAALTSILWPVP